MPHRYLNGMERAQADFMQAYLQVIVEIVRNYLKQPSIWIYIIAAIAAAIILAEKKQPVPFWSYACFSIS